MHKLSTCTKLYNIQQVQLCTEDKVSDLTANGYIFAIPTCIWQALGIKPARIRAPKQPSLDQKDMAQLMNRDEEEAPAPDREAERIKGLGYAV